MTDIDLSCNVANQPTFGCRRQFPFKDYAGLCARCSHLSRLTDPEQIQHDAAAPTCSGCGGIFAHLAPNTQCGICERKTAELEGHDMSQNIQTLKYGSRKDAVTARVLPAKKATPAAQAAASVSKAATVVSGVQVKREIQLYLSPVIPKGTMLWNKLGLAIDTFPETMSFDEVVDKLTSIWNVKWNVACKESLTSEFIDLHFYGNIAFLPESDTQTIGYFYDIHDRILNKDHTKRCPTAIKPGKGPFIYLEGFIDVKKFEQITGANAPEWIKTVKDLANKRKSIGLPSEQALVSSAKRSKVISTTLKSTWVVRIPQGMTKIAVLFATIEINKEDGSTQVWYPATTVNSRTGYIANEEFGRGATKLVYKLILDNKEWAAKRFWTIGKDNSVVSMQENKNEVESESLRLHQLQEILAEFIKHAKKTQVDIAKNIRVTDFTIAIKVVPVNGKPSPASGVTAPAYSALDQDKEFIVWLLEPLRSAKTPMKWSGTMQHPGHNSKVGDTLTSFVHFAYEWTERSVVFADLQTQKAGDPDGTGWQVLFDVMTHTLGGDSGVGDHGIPGIQAFVKMHQCERKCHDLQLASLVEEEEVEEVENPKTKSTRKCLVPAYDSE